MPPSLPVEWELPKLRYSFSFQDDHSVDDINPDTEFFDVKFYPYSPSGANPVFAAVSQHHIFVCRLTQTKDGNPCEIIRVIRDDDDGALNCSCTWTRSPKTKQALLCVAGRDAKIKVYSIKDGKAVMTFVGHGGEINDLATSPANPHLIASASDDTTVRIWSLDPVHKRQPCVCLLGGEGHSWNLLSVAFHNTGRYVLSAGHDQVINLWTLPDIPDEHMEIPIVVHFPHFSSSEIHTGLIDCVGFYGDMILSRACYEDVIVLWRIEGFDSTAEPPSPELAPSNQDTTKLTRSAFTLLTPAPPIASSPVTPAYTRLLQLHTPGCGPQFFMRFGLFHTVGHHPTLAFCNAAAKIFFWDFDCFSAYRQYVTDCLRNDRRGLQHGQDGTGDRNGGGALPRPPWLRIMVSRKKVAKPAGNTAAELGGRRAREAMGLGIGARDAADRGDGSDHESSIVSGGGDGTAPGAAAAQNRTATPNKDKAAGAGSNGTTSPQKSSSAVGRGIEGLYNKETVEDWNSRYNTDNPNTPVKAHKVEMAKGQTAVGRQVAWSPEGEWCVVVGSNSLVMVLQRWAKVAAPADDD